MILKLISMFKWDRTYFFINSIVIILLMVLVCFIFKTLKTKNSSHSKKVFIYVPKCSQN